MTSFSSTLQKIRKDWEDRISFDPRFWMSEAWDSEQSMIESGIRDTAQLLSGLEQSFLSTAKALEYGCGIGRLSTQIAPQVKQLVACDISKFSLQQANLRSKNCGNLSFIPTAGAGLPCVEDASFNLIISHAVISHLPRPVAICIMHDLVRLLAPDGVLRLQLFIGEAIGNNEADGDTLSIRGYSRRELDAAFTVAGLNPISCKEFILPFDARTPCGYFKPYIYEAVRTQAKTISKDDFANLIPYSHDESSNFNCNSPLEESLIFSKVKKDLSRGEIEEALRSLDFIESRTTSQKTLEELKMAKTLILTALD